MTMTPQIYSPQEQATFRKFLKTFFGILALAICVMFPLALALDAWALWPYGLGLIPAVIAYRKGRGFLPWYAFGMLLLIVALPVALCLHTPGKECPKCAETVKEQATVCRYCQHVF